MKRLLIGIDEVGRGALAGPVVLAAVLSRGRIHWTHPELGRIRDSKKLTPKRREAWFRYLAGHPRLQWRTARVGPAVIDRLTIGRAANRGALALAKRLVPPRHKYFVMLDGGLHLPDGIQSQSIVKGDERVPLIAAASIIAKVHRDRLMARLARAFPVYGLHVHKGYATRLHKRMLKERGPSEIHRRTFLGWLKP